MVFALLGGLVSFGVAGALYILTLQMEERLIEETLSAELEDYMARYKLDPRTPPPSSVILRTYVLRKDQDEGVPVQLYGLSPGLHQVQVAGTNYYAEVRVNNGDSFVVLYNDAQVRHRGKQFQLFLAIGILITTILSAVIGWWLARRVILPVGELARRISTCRPEDHSTPLAMDFPQDEVGELAKDFDDYLVRLAAFIDRERAFTADISHELRTPLAIIKGAAEVLLTDSELNDTKRSRVNRIARAAHDASELTRALLMLAREGPNKLVPTAPCDVGELLKQVIDEHRIQLRQKPVSVDLNVNAHLMLPVEAILLRVVLGNLVGNAFAYTQEGQVTVNLTENCVTIADTGKGMSEMELSRAFDRYYSGDTSGGEGIGLSLVKRICQHYQWHIELKSQKDAGTTVHLMFV